MVKKESDVTETAGSSPSFRDELKGKLTDLLPEVFTDGKFDPQKLGELLGDDLSDDRERFGLFWPGKKRALRAAQESTSATLIPEHAKSQSWDSTQNLFIEGDNLEVLKTLQKHYHAKIKMIYIDPPYNTGKDFIYPDNYQEGLQSYLEFTKQVNEGGKKLSTNSDTEGRFHSNWLSMMYPRLKLARNLLKSDGLIYVSIDDHEVANLRLIMDEIFGEANFIENYIWESNFRPDNSSSMERENAQHILCYSRNKKAVQGLIGAQKATEGLPSLTKNSMKISTLKLKKEWVDFQIADGIYKAGDFSSGYRLEQDVQIKNGFSINDFELTGRVIWSQQYLEDQVDSGTRIVIKGDGFVPYSKKITTSALAPTTLLPRENVGDVLAGNADIKALFGSQPFTHPKPVALIKYLILSCTSDDPDAVILDFFAGSGTTGQATFESNLEDSGNRSFILVQLPEPIEEGSPAKDLGFKLISDVTRERIRLAGAKLIPTENQLNLGGGTLDVGFRTYRLADTNFTKWQATSEIEATALEQHILDLRESSEDQASAAALFSEILLKQGYSLTEKLTTEKIAGLDISCVSGNLVMAYLDEEVKPSLQQLKEVLSRMPAKFIILEDTFQADDELKTNLSQECKSRSIELWTA
jgi:adenine-specific DNA-methyltransferase